MKKILLFICLKCIGNFIQAQTAKDSATSTNHKKANLAKDLNLNDTQKKVLPLYIKATRQK